jgi:hypothetical protein
MRSEDEDDEEEYEEDNDEENDEENDEDEVGQARRSAAGSWTGLLDFLV